MYKLHLPCKTKLKLRKQRVKPNYTEKKRAKPRQEKKLSRGKGAAEKWLRCLCPIDDGHVEKQAKASPQPTKQARDREPKRKTRNEAWQAEWVKTAWKQTWNGLSADKWMPRLTAHVYADTKRRIRSRRRSKCYKQLEKPMTLIRICARSVKIKQKH